MVRGGGGEGGEGCGIDELQQLNSLHGSLRIQHLETVSSPKEEREAPLWQKPHLRRLVISMLGRDDDDGAESKRMESILDSLKPHTNLEEPKLFCYAGSKLRIWMSEMQHLCKVELFGGPKLEVLRTYDNVSPTELTVRDCHKLEVWQSSSMLLEKLSVIDSSEFLASGLLSHLLNIRHLRLEDLEIKHSQMEDGMD